MYHAYTTQIIVLNIWSYWILISGGFANTPKINLFISFLKRVIKERFSITLP